MKLAKLQKFCQATYKVLEKADDAKPENLRFLQALTTRLIAERSQEIDEICSHV